MGQGLPTGTKTPGVQELCEGSPEPRQPRADRGQQRSSLRPGCERAAGEGRGDGAAAVAGFAAEAGALPEMHQEARRDPRGVSSPLILCCTVCAGLGAQK